MVLIRKLYTYLSEETFLEKGSPPYPLPKTFNIEYSLTGFNPVRLYSIYKVLGKEFEE